MAWKPVFERAMTAFKSEKYQESISRCTEALDKCSSTKPYFIYDCRSASYEKLGKIKDALRDAKMIIDVAPTRYQGYLRAARLFYLVSKFEECITMADLALMRTGVDDAKRRVEITSLKGTAIEDRRRHACHIARLPVELMSEIFDYLVAYDSPLIVTLSAVCQHWREMTLRAPHLWQTLALTNRSPKKKTETWIGRSKGRIRELSLRMTLLSNHWSRTSLADIRWDHIRICRLEDWDIITPLADADREQLVASLEELEIHDKLFGKHRTHVLAYPFTSLHTVTLEGAIVDFGALPPAPKTLQSLSVHSGTAQHVLSLLAYLAGAEDLVSLIIDLPFGDFVAPTGADSPPDLRLEKLLTFNLAATQGSLNLFRYLDMPSLQHLTLRRSPRAIDAALLSLVTKDLVSLTIDTCVVSASPVVSVLKTSPNLATLALRGLPTGVIETILRAVSLPAEGEGGRRLKHLDVSNCSDVKTGQLMQLVKARIPAVEGAEVAMDRIETLTVDGCPMIDGEYLPWFRQRVKRFSCVYMTKTASKYRR